MDINGPWHISIFGAVLYAIMHSNSPFGLVNRTIRYACTCLVPVSVVHLVTADLKLSQLVGTTGHCLWIVYCAIAVLRGESSGNAYRAMLISSAAFALYDLPICMYRCIPDLLTTAIHHIVVATVSYLLLRDGCKAPMIAAVCNLSEISTALYCVREILKPNGWDPDWLSTLFHATHFLIRGPLVLLTFAWLGPEYLKDRSDPCKALVVLCGVVFVGLNSVWNLAILRKYFDCLKRTPPRAKTKKARR